MPENKEVRKLELSPEDKQQMDDAFKEFAEFENKNYESNLALMKSIGRSAHYMVSKIADGCDIGLYEPMVIVDTPKGELQPEKYGIFKELWVEQWDIKDMPKYVKFNFDYMSFREGVVYPFCDWGQGRDMIGFVTDPNDEYGKAAVPAIWSNKTILSPATELEYNCNVV